MKTALSLLFLFCVVISGQSQQTLNFASLDGLQITADLYETNPSDPIILLCHQARFSRGEYVEIAKRLNQMGFNCLAIDQRSGNRVNDVENETYRRAKSANKATAYLDAEQDISSAIAFVKNRFQQNIILWGSSYSASLALKLANQNSDVSAVVAFSPGEYFVDQSAVAASINGMDKPAFVTSSKSEAQEVSKLLRGVKANASQFVPIASGLHGSKALWSDSPGNAEYWDALTPFLTGLK